MPSAGTVQPALGDRSARLTQVYRDRTIDLDGYRPLKNNLVEETQELKEKPRKAQANNETWLEPVERFVNGLKQAASVTKHGREEEKRDLLKKVGSNLTISDRHLSVVTRDAWKLVAEQGPFA